MMDLLENLRQRIAKRRVVAVVGAGVSIGATAGHEHASWKGLLEAGIDHCTAVARTPDGWADARRRDLASGDTVSWLSVATEVEERLRGAAGGGEGELAAFLDSTIGRLEVREPAVLEALRDLGVPLATTNYDNLLEEVTGRERVTWREMPEPPR